MRMLLVEDEKKVSELVAPALRAERYAVDVAGNGHSGWGLAEVLIREADLNYQIGARARADAPLP